MGAQWLLTGLIVLAKGVCPLSSIARSLSRLSALQTQAHFKLSSRLILRSSTGEELTSRFPGHPRNLSLNIQGKILGLQR
jgi:hypothetical protein